ncbi:alginate lyase family protein [Reichenbachiella agarivorans]|uniref:Alginate lyase family protein n=1 Tax=Reichenbachiella agarivorans TaxID=2979464 RepID=A0ABY6CQH3_9BACT|nr:alginate lyase family protein [Reichenbachiella agarivorans]UXP32614.1 alginate lyase family protein [Reichenbachiella agarivorans]
MKFNFLVIVLLLSTTLRAQQRLDVGAQDFSDWSGFIKTAKSEGSFTSGSTVSYRYPDGQVSYQGFRKYYSNASDWSSYAGLSFDIYQKNESPLEVVVALKVAQEDEEDLNPVSSARIQLVGKGWQTVYVPWDLLDVSEGQKWGTLQGIKTLEIMAKSSKNTKLLLRNVSLTKGKQVSLTSKVQGKSAVAGEVVVYEIEVGNPTLQVQKVQLMFARYGWESMVASIDSSQIVLAPNEVKKCQVEVRIPRGLPEGVREKQVLKAVANGQGAAGVSLELTTAVTVPHPNIVFTTPKWEEVKNKISQYEWAKQGLETYESKASKWKVPEIATALPKTNTHFGRYLFHFNEGSNVMNCAIAYRLTGKQEYAEKCALFLRRLTNMDNGYPTTFRVNQNNFVKEGGVFQDVARAYDMIYDAGVLSRQDHDLIEHTFRLYIETVQMGNDEGGIGNWDLSELTGAFYCALAIQDWHLADAILHAPTGIIQQFAQGVMSDGWWYECSVGYNIWCATMFSEAAIALEPWGVNLKDVQFPIGTTSYYSLMPSRMKPGLYGMNFNKWGNIGKSSIGIKDMWDALIPFLDYRGVMFAVNDAREDLVTGEPYELAYYIYRDPEYAVVVGRSKQRNLLYGVPELADVASEKNKQSAYADNIGIVQLRSQTADRPQREQIQAALHYGSHGGYHGHFDRTNFLSMMRYGRSFYNPEMIWYSYPNYVYKFLVQTSMTKNMVVVDQKMQEPQESARILFHTGKMMQATAVETTARWSHPPYGGMVYGDKEGVSFAEKTWQEGRSIEVPTDAPAYGAVTGYTEPVLQRRLMVMMDDYVLLADYLKAEQEHTYDWLMQMKGFKELSADQKTLVRHDNQMSTDPLSAAQFFTDCDWYHTEGTARTKFEMCFGERCDNSGTLMLHSEDGPLKIDVFNAWPLQNDIMLAMPAEAHNVAKSLWYTVEADDQVLVNDSTGAWVLGSKNIDVDITDKKRLVLTSAISNSNKKTIFWGDAKLILKDGSEQLLSSLPVMYDNIIIPRSKGKDYYDGPVKIAGELMPHSLPGMPENDQEKGIITVDLSAIDAVRFQAKIGGDYPLGDESERRKTMAVRTQGKETSYLSIIEPYETESAIQSVRAKSANELVVVLKDGRSQEITISGLESENAALKVSVKELKNGKIIRKEETTK